MESPLDGLDRMRAFIGIEVSEAVRDASVRLASELRKSVKGARWIPPTNLHLTLRFLGETDEKRLKGMSQELVTTGAECVAFQLKLQGLIALPNVRRPRVLCVAVTNPPHEIGWLHGAVEEIARKHGFPREERNFQPHLTVARFRKPEKELGPILSGLEHRVIGVVRVSDLVLFRSTLKPSGAVYGVVRRFPLAGNSRNPHPGPLPKGERE